MRYTYGQFDGQPFQTPDSLFPSERVLDFILNHGQNALDALEQLKDEDARELVEQMIQAGLLDREPGSGKIKMTPRLLKGMEQKALLDIFKGMKNAGRDGHAVTDIGNSAEYADGTRPYEPGDPMQDVDMLATLKSALTSTLLAAKASNTPLMAPFLPLSVFPNDIEVKLKEGQSDCATCILIDMSGSMLRYGRFYHAKRVAMGLASLIRSRFPLDSVDYVGFYSLARKVEESALPLLMPMPISTYDPVVRLRTPLAKALANEKSIPRHFTNLQMGLTQARNILRRRRGANKQIFIITDGQPTAHIETKNGTTETLYLLYPPEERTAEATLAEAFKCHQQGIKINTFALIEDYWGMDWVSFVDQMAKLTHGTAFYCASPELGSVVIESYLDGKRKKRAV